MMMKQGYKALFPLYEHMGSLPGQPACEVHLISKGYLFVCFLLLDRIERNVGRVQTHIHPSTLMYNVCSML